MARTRDEIYAAAYKKRHEVIDAGVDPYACEFTVSQEEHCILYDDPNLYRGSPVDAREDRICGLKLKVDKTPPALLRKGIMRVDESLLITHQRLLEQYGHRDDQPSDANGISP